MNLFDRALKDGHIELFGSGSKERIRYIASGFSDRFADPEETVRAQVYAELIYRYEYPPSRIGVEITVPDRKPTEHADLVVFQPLRRREPSH